MSVAPQQSWISPEEYLAAERAAQFRSEYLDGRVHAMSGSSPEHDLIVGSLGGLVYAQLRGTPCTFYTSNMKVRTRPNGLYSYPDLTVVCGPSVFHDGHRDVVINPRVIFEVLSPSTEAFDRGRKKTLYQSIDTLTDYVLLAQDEPTVELLSREANNRWVLTTLQGLDQVLRIDSIGCTLALSDLYERVAFPDR